MDRSENFAMSSNNRKCILDNCVFSKKEKSHFFKIPNNADNNENWKQFFLQNKITIEKSKEQFICQHHFRPEMINFENPDRIRLKSSAFPVSNIENIFKSLILILIFLFF